MVGLIGPNGAGKTTTFNLITGNYAVDAGTIAFEGRSITRKRTHRIVQAGIARTFQNVRLFQQLSATENVLAGRHCRTRSGLLGALLRPPWQVREEREAVARAVRELEFVGLAGHAMELARNLAYGDQRRLEIARALAADPKLLILDEPAGGMNEQETDRAGGAHRADPGARHHRPAHRARHEPGDAGLRAHRGAGVRREDRRGAAGRHPGRTRG